MVANSSRKWWRWLAFLLLLAMVVVLGPRNEFGQDLPSYRQPPPDSLAELEAWLAHSESKVADLRPGTAKSIVWQKNPGQRTPWAVVYLHGFSASRLETAPLAETLARQLGANLFATRLTGHGLDGEAMGQATVQDWLADTVEAVRIGRQLGERVLVLGVSTGGTLASWLATRPEGRDVAAYAFVSPNYGPKDRRSFLVNGPWGRQLALAIEGKVRGNDSADPRTRQAWTLRYDTRAIFPMMALVQHVHDSDASNFRSPVLMLYSRGDQTVDPKQTIDFFSRIGSTRKTLEEVTYSEAKGQHVLAGDITAPRAVTPMATRIAAWVQEIER